MPETSEQNVLSKEDIAASVLERGKRSGKIAPDLSIEDLKITVGKQTVFSKSSDRLTGDIKNLQKISLALENPEEFARKHPRTSINISVDGESVYKITNGKLVTNKLGDRTQDRAQEQSAEGAAPAIADLRKGIENKDPEVLAKLEELAKRVEALEKGQTAYAAAHNGLVESVDEFEEKFDRYRAGTNSEISDLEHDVAETRANVQELGFDNENSLDRLSQLENQNKELRDRISQLENKNQKLEKALQTNQQKSQPIKEKVQNFFAKVTRSLAEGTRDVLNGKNDWLNQKTAQAIDFAAQTAKDVLTSPIGEKATEVVVDKVAQGLGWVADKIEGREPQRMDALAQGGQREIAPEKQPAIDVPAKVVEPKLGKEESARKYQEIASRVDGEEKAKERPEFANYLQREDAIAAIALQSGEEQAREIMREGVGYRGDLHAQGESGAERELDSRLEKARSVGVDQSLEEANTIPPEAPEKSDEQVLSEYHDLVIAPKLAAEGPHSSGPDWETVYTDEGFFIKGGDRFKEEGAFAIAKEAGDRWEELGQFSPERGWEANLDAANNIAALEDAIERAKAVRTDSVGEVVAKEMELNTATQEPTEVVKEHRLKDKVIKATDRSDSSAGRKEYEFYSARYDSLQSQGKVKGDRDTWIAAAVLTHRQGDREAALDVIRQGNSFQQESDVRVAEQVLAKRMDNAVAMYKTGSQQATATQVKVQSVNVERSSQKLAR